MSRNLSLLAAVVLLLGAPEITLAFSLKVDMGDGGQSVKPGWEEFTSDGNDEIDPKTEVYDVDGLSVSVSVRTGILNDSGYRDYGNDVVNWDANEPSPGLL